MTVRKDDRGPYCGVSTDELVRRCEKIVREQDRYRQKIQDLDQELAGYRDEITAHRTYLNGERRGNCWMGEPAPALDHGDA